MEKPGGAGRATDGSACYIPEAAETHSEYVVLIVFPLQQRLHKRASLLTLYLLFLSCVLQSYCAH